MLYVHLNQLNKLKFNNYLNWFLSVVSEVEIIHAKEESKFEEESKENVTPPKPSTKFVYCVI